MLPLFAATLMAYRYVLFIVQCLFWTWISERFNQRFFIGLFSELYTLPLLIALELLPANASPWVKWALSTLVVGHPYAHPVIVAITSRNAGAVRTRTVASALYNISVQIGSIVGSNVSSLCFDS
jgi:predicted MFS family arabinose efflux permease